MVLSPEACGRLRGQRLSWPAWCSVDMAIPSSGRSSPTTTFCVCVCVCVCVCCRPTLKLSNLMLSYDDHYPLWKALTDGNMDRFNYLLNFPEYQVSALVTSFSRHLLILSSPALVTTLVTCSRHHHLASPAAARSTAVASPPSRGHCLLTCAPHNRLAAPAAALFTTVAALFSTTLQLPLTTLLLHLGRPL